MKWTSYTLKRKVTMRNEINEEVVTYDTVCDIDVIISMKLYTNVSEDVVARIFEPTAITKYKAFDTGITYVITNDKHCYEVDSFNVCGKYAQLLLKEVIL